MAAVEVAAAGAAGRSRWARTGQDKPRGAAEPEEPGGCARLWRKSCRARCAEPAAGAATRCSDEKGGGGGPLARRNRQRGPPGGAERGPEPSEPRWRPGWAGWARGWASPWGRWATACPRSPGRSPASPRTSFWKERRKWAVRGARDGPGSVRELFLFFLFLLRPPVPPAGPALPHRPRESGSRLGASANAAGFAALVFVFIPLLWSQDMENTQIYSRALIVDVNLFWASYSEFSEFREMLCCSGMTALSQHSFLSVCLVYLNAQLISCFYTGSIKLQSCSTEVFLPLVWSKSDVSHRRRSNVCHCFVYISVVPRETCRILQFPYSQVGEHGPCFLRIRG